MIKATPLTETSWLLTEDFRRAGLMRKLSGDKFSIIGGEFSGIYTSVDDFTSKTNKIIDFKQEDTKKEVIKEVNGYPIKHDESFEIMEEKQYSTYSKKEKSEDRYAAGYFSIQFKNKWQQSFCPRVNTLVNNPFYGPFKTKMELDHYIKTENSKQG